LLLGDPIFYLGEIKTFSHMLDITIPILKKNRAKKYQVSNILDGCDQIKNFEFIYQIKIGQAIKIVKFEALKVRRFRLVNV
jgi:hypothetical protein